MSFLKFKIDLITHKKLLYIHIMLILEKRGISDIIKEIIDENLNTIIGIMNNNIDGSINLYVDKKLIKNALKCELLINFYFEKKYNYTGDINYLSIIQNNFKNCIINIYLPFNPNINNLLSALSHELTHLYELYQIKDIFNKTKWENTTILNDLGKMDLLDEYKSLKYFKDLFYLSLPHEIRARITSLHFYLLNLRTNDNKELINNLISTKEYRYYKMLKNFNVNNYYENLSNEMDLDSMFNFFNFFINIMSIKFKKIETKNDLFVFLNKTNKYFNDVCFFYKKKISRIMKDVGLTNFDYLLEDKDIHSFEEYKNNFKKPEEINYNNYFQ